MAVKLQINGSTEAVALKTSSLAELLRLKGVQEFGMVSVQKNGELVDQSDYETTTVGDGDEIEYLFFMGGGAQK